MLIKKGNLPDEPKLHINSMLLTFHYRITNKKLNEYELQNRCKLNFCVYQKLKGLSALMISFVFIYSYRRYIKEIGNNLTDVSDQN